MGGLVGVAVEGTAEGSGLGNTEGRYDGFGVGEIDGKGVGFGEGDVGAKVAVGVAVDGHEVAIEKANGQADGTNVG